MEFIGMEINSFREKKTYLAYYERDLVFLNEVRVT